jgi:hypothetical protein
MVVDLVASPTGRQKAIDTFWIKTDTYQAAGNVQLHKEPARALATSALREGVEPPG